jgi:hypothetical protein
MNNAEKTEQWQAQAKRDGVSIPDVMLAYTEMIDSHDAGALSAGMVYTFFSRHVRPENLSRAPADPLSV